MKNKTPPKVQAIAMLALLAAILFAAAWACGYIAGRVDGAREYRRIFAADVWIENISGNDENTVLSCTAELSGADPRSIIPPGQRVHLEAYWPDDNQQRSER